MSKKMRISQQFEMVECPFCQRTDCLDVKILPKPYNNVSIHCSYCYTDGPKSSGLMNAIGNWNYRGARK